jgi:hypothetical protein
LVPPLTVLYLVPSVRTPDGERTASSHYKEAASSTADAFSVLFLFEFTSTQSGTLLDMLKNTNKNFGRLVLLFMIVGTALIMKAQVLTSSSLSSLKTSMSESQKESDYILLPHPKFNIPLKLVIAKTVSVKDVRDTISDIQALKERYSHHYQIQWKLFCYKNETYESLLEQSFDEDGWKQDYNTEIYLWPGKNKINFWYKYLNPELIPSDIDYIWMMDGDIRLRNMAWDCFWNFVAEFQPAIFAPSIMSSSDPQSEHRKFYAGSTHPQKCHTADPSMGKNNDIQHLIATDNWTVKDNDIQHLIAMDIWTVEIQLPIFTRFNEAT